MKIHAWTVPFLLLLAAPAFAQDAAHPLDAASCQALINAGADVLGDPTAHVTAADLRGPSEAAPPRTTAMPAHCEIFGKMQEHQGPFGQTYAIKFHLRLPVAWNGRFFFGGGGGTNGVVGAATGNLLGAQSKTAIEMGYAVVTTDTGHDNGTNTDPKRQGQSAFGFDDQARRNFGGAAIPPVTAAARGLINAFYGRKPAYSYYVGGSKGGQEAFAAAQRYGTLFDGILAGYPGFRLPAAAVTEMADDQTFARVARKAGQLDKDGLPLINKAFSDDDLALVSNAILAACDTLDGLKDGMVENFPACTDGRVYPAFAKVTCKGAKTPECLSSDQVAALKEVYKGPHDSKGRPIYVGRPWDAGIGGKAATGYFTGWRGWNLGSYNSAQNNAISVTLAGGSASALFSSPPPEVPADPQSMTRFALADDIEKNDAATRVKWGSFNESAVDYMNVDSDDLSAFRDHGGKLMIYQGVSDPVFSINDTIAWLKRLDAKEKGQSARYVRLFAVPGMNHGGGGPATDQIDLFSALVAWTEHGVAPDHLVGTAQKATNWPGRTRLLCPYPQQPRYVSGDSEKAESFACKSVGRL